MSKRVTVGDLRDQIGSAGPRELLYCPTCFEEYSANAGDYWNAPRNLVFKHCRRNMRLGFKMTTYRDLEPTR